MTLEKMLGAFTSRVDRDGTGTSQLLTHTDGSLMLRKLRQLFLVTLVSRFFTMIMLNVDSIVVGWKLGAGAVASVNYLLPFDSIMGALTALVSNGVATLMSKQLGDYDPVAIERKKKAVLVATLTLTAVLSVIQIPICLLLFGMYGMDAEISAMAWRYAFVCMLFTPFSIMNTIGSYLLASTGHVKTTLRASVIEGVANAVMDVLFVFGLNMSTEGVGLGNLLSGLAFFFYIVHCLRRDTTFLHIDWSVRCHQELLSIPRYGAMALVNAMSSALFDIALFWFITQRLSDSGVAIHSVCLFSASILLIVNNALVSALQPLTGMLSTIGDRVGMHQLLKQTLFLSLATGSCFTLIVWAFPEPFFRAYGFAEIPAMGVAILRAYALHFVLRGANALIRIYFNTWDEPAYASTMSMLNSIVLPCLFSALFFLFGPPYTIWLCYAVAHVICIALEWTRYLRSYRKVQASAEPTQFNCVIHPSEVPAAAGQLQDVLRDNGIPSSLAHRAAICVEEIGAYALPSKKRGQVTIQLYSYIDGDEATVVMLDDGQCVALPEPGDEPHLALGNYEVLRSVASDTAYEYVLDMNFFTVKLRGSVRGSAAHA